MSIKTILVTSVAPMDMHRANSGQNYLGNATAIKRRNDGRVYISGQMQRHALFSAIDRLNDNPDTMVSNGDGTSFMIETDLRADLGGFMHTEISGEPGPPYEPRFGYACGGIRKKQDGERHAPPPQYAGQPAEHCHDGAERARRYERLVQPRLHRALYLQTVYVRGKSNGEGHTRRHRDHPACA